ncbi:Ulp1 protease family, carboxy-terminal domain protein [Arachis hypogaea]|nr:Ulp1 protease family, carboxy-terminal domain protein [Arachis hypogaea]
MTMPKIDDVRTEGEMGSSATMEKAGVGDSDDDAATHHRCGACLVSLPDSCAPPSVLMNSFERRVMADLEFQCCCVLNYLCCICYLQDIKRANNSIREEQILLKSMIERINSIYVKPELKENERLLKNSKTNPIITPHKTCKITENIKKSDSKSIFNMDVDPNICLDVSDDEDDVMELDRTTITRQYPRKVAKLSLQPNGKRKAKPLSKPWFLGPGERRTRFQNRVEAFRGVQQPRRISTSEMDAQVSHGEAVRASSTPVAARGITTYFKMGGEINLSKGQVEMFAYVFDSDLLPSEHIVKIGGSSATRQELFCLSKDHIITAKIMELWARKCTWEQRSITLKTTWCLPPSFLVDVFQHLQIEELIDKYADYMGKYPSLEYIYIPIKDNDHWYLMVMSLEPKIVFHLDSNLPHERKEPRTQSTNTLAVVLSQIISSAHFEACPFEHGDFSGGWSSQTIEVVHDVQPPPTCQEDSALWISENQVLITTTIDLVLGSSNELRKTIMDNASEHWFQLNELNQAYMICYLYTLVCGI